MVRRQFNVTVIPIDDAAFEGKRNGHSDALFERQLHARSGTNAVTVTITDSETVVSVAASDANASEAGPDNGVFTITRTTTSGALTVNYTITGTATNNTDYSTIVGSATIPNGSSTVNRYGHSH